MIERLCDAWRRAWQSRALRVQIVATPLCLVAALRVLAVFLLWVERRPGVRLSDPLLDLLAPRNATWLVFGLLYLAVVLAFGALAVHPREMVIGVQAYVVLLLSRIGVMYFTALDPPPDMVPLRDPLVEIIGTGRLLTRDLFFSGHTSTLFLLLFAVPDRRIKTVLLAFAVVIACAVLKQHAHYTVDVLVAPVFAFASHRAVLAVHRRLGAAGA